MYYIYKIRRKNKILITKVKEFKKKQSPLLRHKLESDPATISSIHQTKKLKSMNFTQSLNVSEQCYKV